MASLVNCMKADDVDEDKWDRERAFNIADSLENVVI